MAKYDPSKIEKKWQQKWQQTGLFKINKDDTAKEKFYVLDMFPYPSGTGLHMGHVESYTASDIFYRFKRMQGFNVLHPQGFDSFGLPAENYAIKTGVHPAETTRVNMATYIKQMDALGFAYDFDEKAVTSDPSYYKWTQWIFGKFFENGLVYKKTQKANWCPSCQTVIANEQVADGNCDRCGTEIVQKEVPGWFFKITDFSDELIEDLDKVDWPEHTKKNQRNWIGKSEGATVKFEIKISNLSGISNSKFQISNQVSSSNDKISKQTIEVFTTRVDTIFGATYVVVAPEHEILKQVQDDKLKIDNLEEVEAYVEEAKNKTELDRMEAKEKTGVELKGIMAINPFNDEEIPVFVADYVLGGYGTGAVMAVPAHDKRDWEFAKNKKLKIRGVINAVSIYDFIAKRETDNIGGNEIINADVLLRDVNTETEEDAIRRTNKEIIEGKICFTGDGILVDSGEFSGLKSEEAREKMTAWLEEKRTGKKVINYRLRDWSISRQRYWGCPIPIVYSPEGEAKFVGEENLPWTLPEDVDFVPTGVAPLAKSEELKKRVKEIFGKGWTAEYDTMDTFVDSSWYFLRYPDPKNEEKFCSDERLKRWLPVDLYIGGAEHTYMHLLFARFFTKAMKRIGLLDFDEPFLKLRHQGMVLDKHGKKMSKSKGNVINPDDMVGKFGADSVRTYMMFASPLEDEVVWNEENIVGVYRFMEKVWDEAEKVLKNKEASTDEGLISGLHMTIKKVGADIEGLKYNTAISEMMKFANSLKKASISKNDFEKFLKILSPFAPHLTEEIWEKLGNDGSITTSPWPTVDEKYLKKREVEMVVQVNGKVRDRLTVSVDVTEDEIKETALESEKVKIYLEGKEIKKIIFIPGKLISIVVA